MELLEIEKELAGPDGEAAMAKYDERLVALASRVKTAMDAGVEPAEFAKLKELDEAVTLARKLIRLQRKSAQ